MSTNFLQLLDSARHIAKVPFVLTSAYRSKLWEQEQGRSGTSSHTKGLAVDIGVANSSDRYKILNALISIGINRIGVGENFIHADVDKDKPQSVIWHYYG